MASDCFQPRIPVSVGQIRSLLFDTRIMKDLRATAQINGESASTIIDGDPNTFVLAGDPKAPLRDTVELVITFPLPVAMSGLVLMPRQNHREHEGTSPNKRVRPTPSPAPRPLNPTEKN